ncbi:MAG: outer membrane lipoprotein-sorting protein [Bacteroidia bacterium]|nr:outer membrane lipoprotein-sorting protein [Bacteroidia bacterium]NND25448.1 outer membrane lipoprotein-sorting protein [Flavobacteriaceae bacterium]MBT8278944.1 outer membrane lipoprotein-sorting protein [Bacteroidia bacterium]NNK60618.1 outer membrane lipoprotein-sorting protein [Flavobacteriaceae bacterium]NNL32168.1 outer membrane lipoprotein-sorting protein [Flavobacteriaceae bacterium]
MKKLHLILFAFAVTFMTTVNAQTADEIIDAYFENTGGLDAWNKVEGLKMTAKINQGGMEIPLEIVQLKSGKQMVKINFQGQIIKQGVYDGESFWSHNFMTRKAEKSDAETTANAKLDLNDFPDPFLNYKEKGYTVELMGTEDFNGTETFKIKLVMEPVTVDGIEEENIVYYFFETENMVPIARQSEVKIGQGKGMISEITYSDYQEAGDLFLPYSMTQGVKGQPGQPITMDSIEINPEVDDSEFTFPVEVETKEGDGNDKKN